VTTGTGAGFAGRGASGDRDVDDGVVLVVVLKLRYVGLCASDRFLSSGSRVGSSALRAILVQVVLAALAGGVFVAAGTQLGDPDRGRSAFGATGLALWRPLVVGGAALLILAVDTAEGAGGAIVGLGRGGAREGALLGCVVFTTTYRAVLGLGSRKYCSGHG
jgi:hypothetical protein